MRSLSQKYKKFLRKFCKTFLEVSDPEMMIVSSLNLNKGVLSIQGEEIKLTDYKKIVIVSVGKCSDKMYRSLSDMLSCYGHKALVISNNQGSIKGKNITKIQGNHPVPGEKSFKAGKELHEFLTCTKRDDLLIANISGGASSLVVLPETGISMKDLKKLYFELLNSPANISEINCVRKHVSRLKGGHAMKLAEAGKVIQLLISDTPDNNPATIGSGPFSPDETTFSDALNILHSYNLISMIPGPVLSVLKSGQKGEIAETPGSDDSVFSGNITKIIGSNAYVLKNIKEIIEKTGLKVKVYSSEDSGGVQERSAEFSSFIREKLTRRIKSTLYLSGGEYTLDVKGSGKGGRNCEFILSLLKDIGEVKGDFFAFSLGSDGIDGNTDAAGAWIDESTFLRSKGVVNKPISYYLENNDSYSFFREIGQLIKTGITGTNVMDIRGVYFP